MDSQALHQKYLSQGTAGYAIIRRFYAKYGDVLARVNLTDPNDVVHELFVTLSKIDFSQIENIEHYVMRAIKLHCWSLLDKGIRTKARMADHALDSYEVEESGGSIAGTSTTDHTAAIEGMELLTNVNLFKAQLNPRDSQLLNLLIDETERSEIASLLGLNLNTLDTNIRRLRIRLADFLKNLGYSYKSLGRFV